MDFFLFLNILIIISWTLYYPGQCLYSTIYSRNSGEIDQIGILQLELWSWIQANFILCTGILDIVLAFKLAFSRHLSTKKLMANHMILFLLHLGYYLMPSPVEWDTALNLKIFVSILAWRVLIMFIISLSPSPPLQANELQEETNVKNAREVESAYLKDRLRKTNGGAPVRDDPGTPVTGRKLVDMKSDLRQKEKHLLDMMNDYNEKEGTLLKWHTELEQREKTMQEWEGQLMNPREEELHWEHEFKVKAQILNGPDD